MVKTTADIQFTFEPCPVCKREFTPQDVERLGDNKMRLRHDCQEGDCRSYIVYGDNLRMVNQDWNRLLWRYNNDTRPLLV